MSLHLAPILVRLIVAVPICGIGYIVLVNVIRRLFWGSMTKDIAASRTRAQHPAFVVHLRELVFKDPFRFIDMLCSKESEWFVRKMWQEVGDKVARVGMTRIPPESAPAPTDALAQSHPIRLSDEGMAVERVKMRDGSMLAVVRLPEPQLRNEAYLVGVLLPNDGSLRNDILRARRLVRFFVLNRWDGERSTDFCEWTVAGKQLTFNTGAPRTAKGFAEAIQAKVDELRSRRVRSA
jgi:hypothetical protein